MAGAKIFEAYGTVRADLKGLAGDMARAKNLIASSGLGKGITSSLSQIGKTLSGFPVRVFTNLFSPTAAGLAAAMTDRIGGTGQALAGLGQVTRGTFGLMKQAFGWTGPSIFSRAITRIGTAARVTFGPMASRIGAAFAPFKENLGMMGAGFMQFSAGLVRGTAGWASMWVATLSGGVKMFASAFSRIGAMARQVIGPIAAIGGAMAIAGSIKTFADFEYMMARTGAVSRATASEFAQLTAAARALGRDTIFTATQAAEAQFEMSKGGFSVAETLAASTPALHLAAAASLSMADASMYMVRIIRSQNLEAAEAARVADVLTNAANRSATDVPNLAEAFRALGPVTRQAGYSVESTAGILMALAQAGLEGSSAGNNVRRVMTRLVQQKREAKSAMEGIGLTSSDIEDENGNMRSLADIIDAVNRQFAGLTAVEQQRQAGLIAGAYAQSAFTQLLNVGGDEIRRNTALISERGTAMAQHDAMVKTLKGSFLLMVSAIQDMSISLGKALAPMLESVAGWFREMANRLGPWIEMNGKTIASVAGITLAIGGLVVVLPLLGRAILGMFGPVGIMLGLLTTLGVAIFQASKEPGFLQDAFKQMGTAMSAVGRVFAGIWKTIGPLMVPVGNAILGMLRGIGNWVTANQATLVRYGIAMGRIFMSLLTGVGNVLAGIGQLTTKILNLFGIKGDNFLETFTSLVEGVALATGNIEGAMATMWANIVAISHLAIAKILQGFERIANASANMATLGAAGRFVQADFGSAAQLRMAADALARGRGIWAEMQADQHRADVAAAAAGGDTDAMRERIADLRRQAESLMPSSGIRIGGIELDPTRSIGFGVAGQGSLGSSESARLLRNRRLHSQRMLEEAQILQARLSKIESDALAESPGLGAAWMGAAGVMGRELSLQSQIPGMIGGGASMIGLGVAADIRRRDAANRAASAIGIVGPLAGGFGGLGALAGLATAGTGIAGAAATAASDAGAKVTGVSDLWRQIQEGMGGMSAEDRREQQMLTANETTASNTTTMVSSLDRVLRNPPVAVAAP